jgi:hypothetical protein
MSGQAPYLPTLQYAGTFPKVTGNRRQEVGEELGTGPTYGPDRRRQSMRQTKGSKPSMSGEPSNRAPGAPTQT